MMEKKKNEVNVGRDVIELVGQPLALRSGGFVERAIEREDEGIASPDRVIAAVLQIREALEIIAQRDFLFAVQIVISESRIDRNFLFPQDAGLAVPDLPVVGVVPVIDDIAGEAD